MIEDVIAASGIVRPDALMISESLKRGRRQIERIDSILDIGEPMLAIDRSKGERAYVRRQGDGWLFLTRDPEDTLYHPIRSRNSGQPRYEWKDHKEGIRIGFLAKEVKSDA